MVPAKGDGMIFETGKGLAGAGKGVSDRGAGYAEGGEGVAVRGRKLAGEGDGVAAARLRYAVGVIWFHPCGLAEGTVFFGHALILPFSSLVGGHT